MAQQSPPTPAPVPGEEPSELRDFMLVVREALYLVIRYIERKYGKRQSPH